MSKQIEISSEVESGLFCVLAVLVRLAQRVYELENPGVEVTKEVVLGTVARFGHRDELIQVIQEVKDDGQFPQTMLQVLLDGVTGS